MNSYFCATFVSESVITLTKKGLVAHAFPYFAIRPINGK